jgi:hypothetical protein
MKPSIPVARFASVRTVLSIAAGRSMHVHQMDVDTAFQLSKLKEEIYIQQPEGYVVPGMEDHVLQSQQIAIWSQAISSGLVQLYHERIADIRISKMPVRLWHICSFHEREADVHCTVCR